MVSEKSIIRQLRRDASETDLKTVEQPKKDRKTSENLLNYVCKSLW